MFRDSLFLGTDSEIKRQEIKTCFHTSYKRRKSFFDVIKDKCDYFKLSDLLAHSLFFYYDYTTTFVINKLKLAKLIDQRGQQGLRVYLCSVYK